MNWQWIDGHVFELYALLCLLVAGPVAAWWIWRTDQYRPPADSEQTNRREDDDSTNGR